MKITRVCALYWSATGNTRALALGMGRKLSELFSCEFEEIDFTPAEAREKKRSFRESDLVVVGAPTYAGKLPNKILPDFQEKLEGNRAAAAAIVSYGNRSFDNSLAELKETLERAGFRTAGGAAFSCRHAFTDMLAPGKPSETDLKEAERFAEELAERIGECGAEKFCWEAPGDAAAPYYVPRGTDGEPAKFLKAKPRTDMQKCTSCGRCVALCPMRSIDAKDVSKVPGICIKCQACVRGCPERAKYFDDAAFLSHVAMLEQNYAEPVRKNVFFVARPSGGKADA